MTRQDFDQFANDIHDIFGTIGNLSRVIGDDLMDVENLILDDPNVDIEAEKTRIRTDVANRVKGVLTQFGITE